MIWCQPPLREGVGYTAINTASINPILAIRVERGYAFCFNIIYHFILNFNERLQCLCSRFDVFVVEFCHRPICRFVEYQHA
jgi:hypothetical protein